MEEVWTEITLSATPDLHAPKPPSAGLILQDMLNRNTACAGGEYCDGKWAERREQSKPCFLTASPNSLLLDSTSSSPSLLNSFPMNQSSNLENRKLIRMIKNRESAARSRDRKMAYMFELEAKKKHLTEENERLSQEVEKQQLVQFDAEIAPKEKAHKKRRCCKSLSSLF
ncbi:LOW QUALITY PROTEIN: hypothetical protein V2J09_023916 [Rumex salicifolius]